VKKRRWNDPPASDERPKARDERPKASSPPDSPPDDDDDDDDDDDRFSRKPDLTTGAPSASAGTAVLPLEERRPPSKLPAPSPAGAAAAAVAAAAAGVGVAAPPPRMPNSAPTDPRRLRKPLGAGGASAMACFKLALFG
jgi:hypothetical protein